jgi:hypothetical protein
MTRSASPLIPLSLRGLLQAELRRLGAEVEDLPRRGGHLQELRLEPVRGVLLEHGARLVPGGQHDLGGVDILRKVRGVEVAPGGEDEALLAELVRVLLGEGKEDLFLVGLARLRALRRGPVSGLTGLA